MGLLRPSLPDLDYRQWRQQARMERLRPLVRHWADQGLGAPEGVYGIYVLKAGLYIAAGAVTISRTPGLGGLSHLGMWWHQPVALEKAVIFSLLFEVLGLGCGFGPLTMRFLPPVGGFLFWLRPGTIRLPPWPGRVPGTAGTRRGAGDVLLYLGVLGSAAWLLAAGGSRATGALPAWAGLIEPAAFLPLIAFLALLGLRDKTVFLAARSEVYLLFALAFLLPDPDLVIAARLVMVTLWWGAAFSKLNRHFPAVVATMESNHPLIRVRALKRALHVSYPDDLRPSGAARALAHGGTAVEFGVPLVLLATRGGPLTTAAALVMIAFHLQILLALPMGVPLEWNIFMIYAILVLFIHDARFGVSGLTRPLPVAVGLAVVAAVIVGGNLMPARFSFLLSMRYYAGNWATSLWCLTPDAIARLAVVTGFPGLAGAQLARLYGAETADVMAHLSYTFRAMHLHGRALFGLIGRAAGPDHETACLPLDGELIAGPTIGWNFGDGHLHNEQLLAALQERCGFLPGEVRVIILEAQPLLRPRQQYRLVDAATGEFERGYVLVADMLARQPWAGEIPVQVTPRPPVPPAGPAGDQVAGAAGALWSRCGKRVRRSS